MQKAFSSAHLVLALALAGSVGVGAALAANAATSGGGHPQASTAVRQLAPALDEATATTTTAPAQNAGRDSTVSLTEATRIAELIGGGQVMESGEESTPTGVAYELRVLRADGTMRDLVVDGRDGRVLANRVQGQPVAQDASDGAVPESDKSDHSDRSDHGDHSEG